MHQPGAVGDARLSLQTQESSRSQTVALAVLSFEMASSAVLPVCGGSFFHAAAFPNHSFQKSLLQLIVNMPQSHAYLNLARQSCSRTLAVSYLMQPYRCDVCMGPYRCAQHFPHPRGTGGEGQGAGNVDTRCDYT